MPFVRPAMTWEVTSRASYLPPDVASLAPTKSYAPPREFVPSNAPLGLSTNREFFIRFQAQPPTLSARPTQAVSAFNTKVSAVTTSRLSYPTPELSPTKSYAPSRVFIPNPAPLGTSTHREVYRAFAAQPRTRSARPPHPSSNFGAKVSAVTTTRSSFVRPENGAPARSYAPARVFVPNPAPLGQSTSRAEYAIF